MWPDESLHAIAGLELCAYHTIPNASHLIHAGLLTPDKIIAIATRASRSRIHTAHDIATERNPRMQCLVEMNNVLRDACLCSARQDVVPGGALGRVTSRPRNVCKTVAIRCRNASKSKVVDALSTSQLSLELQSKSG